MIVVRIDLWPGGDGARARELGRMYVANVGGTADRGEYDVAVCRKGSTEVPAEILGKQTRQLPKAARTGHVEDYPRKAYNVWRLIARAVLAAFPEEGVGKGVETRCDDSVIRGLNALATDDVADIRIQGDTSISDVEAAQDWLTCAMELRDWDEAERRKHPRAHSCTGCAPRETGHVFARDAGGLHCRKCGDPNALNTLIRCKADHGPNCPDLNVHAGGVPA